MFCSQCGKNIPADATFCPYCGSQAINPQASISPKELPPGPNEQPLAVLKPVFIPWYTLLSSIPILLFVTVWGGFFLGIILYVLSSAMGIAWPFINFIIVTAFVIFFGGMYLLYYLQQRTILKTSYSFFKDKLVYYEGFINIEKKVISYNKVIEVSLREGIIQRKYNVGTLVLSIPAANLGDNKPSGIRLINIKKPNEVYKKLSQLVNQANTYSR